VRDVAPAGGYSAQDIYQEEEQMEENRLADLAVNLDRTADMGSGVWAGLF
jgi:hypothetical protein